MKIADTSRTNKDAVSPINGNNMQGLRLPFLSLHPPANKIIKMPNTVSENVRITVLLYKKSMHKKNVNLSITIQGVPLQLFLV